MSAEVFSEAMGLIGEKYIMEAATYQRKKYAAPKVWLSRKEFECMEKNMKKIISMAACLCLLFVGVFIVANINRETPIQEDLFAEADGFQMNDAIYRPITFDERKEFNLVPAEDMGLSEENKYIITEKDLGKQMGVIEECPNEALIGLPVYHFALWAEDERICIVDANGTYAFYVRD